MDVIEAIRTRRTTKAYRADEVSDEVITRVLDAAVWAPNHRLTEPWEFIVVRGEALAQLAVLRREMTAKFLTEQQVPADSERIERQAEEAYRKTLAAPVTIAVTVGLHQDAIVREEDFAATAIAIQTMMLAAHSLGLGSFLSTNALIRYPPALQFLGVPADRRVIGLVQLGYAAQDRQSRRKPASSCTRWLGGNGSVPMTASDRTT
jgi:nitroreductase